VLLTVLLAYALLRAVLAMHNAGFSPAFLVLLEGTTLAGLEFVDYILDYFLLQEVE